MSNDLTSIVLTSVVISSVVSSFIGGFFLLLSERSKRISEEKRTKLEIAGKLTELYDKKVVELIKLNPKKTLWRNHSKTFKNYYNYLEKIWKNNKYTEDFDSPIPNE